MEQKCQLEDTDRYMYVMAFVHIIIIVGVAYFRACASNIPNACTLQFECGYNLESKGQLMTVSI